LIASRNGEAVKVHRATKNGVAQGPRSSSNERPSNGVAKVKRFKLKPMTVEQAGGEMDQLGHSFFVFLNDDTQELNILYRRHDETLGLVEADLS